jgi:PEP-CTERM motif
VIDQNLDRDSGMQLAVRLCEGSNYGNREKKMRAAGLACALSLIAGSAVAGPITWDVNGTITFTRDADLLPVHAQFGDAYTYSVTFDSAAADSFPETAFGNFPGAIQSIVFATGGVTYDIPIADGSTIQTFNDVNSDYYQLSFLTQSGANNAIPLFMSQLNFQSTSPLAFDTDALPTSPPADLSLYTVNMYLFEYQTLEEAQGTSPIPLIIGGVDSIVQRPVAVPEPTTAMLLATGLLGMWLARRRRREHA